MEKLSTVDEVADRFAAEAMQFCTVIDRVPSLARVDFLRQIDALLPKLIDQAISLPEVTPTNRAGDEGTVGETVAERHDAWRDRYILLRNALADWDLYREMFDPVNGTELMYGSLADDLADIYQDLLRPLSLPFIPAEDRIWYWQFSFRTHWGNHAINALRAIRARLQG